MFERDVDHRWIYTGQAGGKIIPAPDLKKNWSRSVGMRMLMLARHKWTLESNLRTLSARPKHFDFHLISMGEYGKVF